MQKTLVRLLLVAFVLASCTQMSPWVKRNRPWTAELIEDAKQVRVTPEGGDSIVLEHARIARPTNEILGVPAGSASLEEVAFDLDELERLETRETMDSDVENHIVGNVLGYLLALVVGLIVVESMVS